MSQFFTFSFTGQYVTLQMLKSFTNGDKVNITNVISDIQIDSSAQIENLQRKIYFKVQKEVTVYYSTEDGQSNQTMLHNLKQVRCTYSKGFHYLGYCQISIFNTTNIIIV